MRTLIHVPSIHHPIQMGDELYQQFMNLWPDLLYRFEVAQTVYWTAIAAIIEGHHINKLFDEAVVVGVPQFPQPYLDHYTKAALFGCRESQLKINILNSGTELTPVESRQALQAHANVALSQKTHSKSYVDERDRAFAAGIDALLADEETGLSVVGAGHATAAFARQYSTLNVITPPQHLIEAFTRCTDACSDAMGDLLDELYPPHVNSR